LESLKETIIDGKNTLRMLQNKLVKFPELDKFYSVISQDIEILRSFEKAIDTSWDEAFIYGQNFTFDRWPTDKKIILALKDEAKEIRSNVKDMIKDKKNDILLYNSEEAYKDIFYMYEILNSLKNLVLEFDKEFKKQKKENNIIDFNDIEHYALKILVKKDDDGNYIPTQTAQMYASKFKEIAIDEYQDSNQVQEQILTSVSNENNIFMVGDVKQSIYKFRRACPDLFLNKYQKYSIDGNEKGLKIQLFKNFRSKKNILDVTNTIFESIMSSKLGEIEYNEEEYLNLVDKMKKRIPNLVLSTDIIVGFPGETEEDFEDTLDVVRKMNFEQIFMFIYSRRVGTPGDKMENQIPEEIKHQRFDKLKELYDSRVSENNEKYVGTTQKLLVEGFSKNDKNVLTGRTDTNKVVNFEGTEDLIGKIINIKITEEHKWYLTGKI